MLSGISRILLKLIEEELEKENLHVQSYLLKEMQIFADLLTHFVQNKIILIEYRGNSDE